MLLTERVKCKCQVSILLHVKHKHRPDKSGLPQWSCVSRHALSASPFSSNTPSDAVLVCGGSERLFQPWTIAALVVRLGLMKHTGAFPPLEGPIEPSTPRWGPHHHKVFNGAWTPHGSVRTGWLSTSYLHYITAINTCLY